MALQLHTLNKLVYSCNFPVVLFVCASDYVIEDGANNILHLPIVSILSQYAQVLKTSLTVLTRWAY